MCYAAIFDPETREARRSAESRWKNAFTLMKLNSYRHVRHTALN